MVKKGLESQNSDAIVLQWTVHPIRRSWKVSAGVVLFLTILCAAIYFSFNSATLLFLSIAILVSSLSPFFFPTTYIFRDDCIVIKSLLRRLSRQWDFFKSYYPDKNGVLLSPFPCPSRLENFRGVYIRFERNRSDIMDFVQRKIEEN